MASFSASDIPSAVGRTIVVTGANSGIGRVTARVLVDRAAHVVLAVRDLDKGREAAALMGGEVEVRHLDLADLSSVRLFAKNFAEPISVLINNAGLSLPPLSHTADGFELQFGTNHLGHFALTNLLLPQIQERVVTVASQAHRLGTIDFSDLNWERKPYRANLAYGQSKLANLLFTTELQRRLRGIGSTIIATAAHPGISVSNLLRPERNNRRARLSKGLLGMIAQSEDDGALPTLYAATADIPGDSYVGPKGFMELRGAPVLVGRTAKAKDVAAARQLWAVSEEMTGTTFPTAALQRQRGKRP